MQLLHTIQEVHKMFNTTGSSPLLVTCNDFNDWVCKYDQHTQYLFNEVLAAEFAKFWNINVPETCLITVNEEHVPYDKFPSLSPNLFMKECFGSRLIENTVDVNLALVPVLREKNFIEKIKQKTDFLNIALFDIWLSNEDRHYGNNNLLLYYSPENYYFFYAIDHVCIFNSAFLKREIVELTEEDTILNTEIAKLLFGSKRKLTEIVDNLVEKFYLCTKDCETNLDLILALIPESWGIDKQDIKGKIEQNLFSDEWKKKCEITFREYVQSFIVN
ncbi:HipA family kinase [Flavobacterium suncheonense]|uniref:HipA family kinase n=1 Tax=Flavobacterium suncheonense TaxID=350894 RepID=UPI003FA3B2F6